MAKEYSLDVEKVKGMVAEAEVKETLETRKAVKVITESAVAVASEQ